MDAWQQASRTMPSFLMRSEGLRLACLSYLNLDYTAPAPPPLFCKKEAIVEFQLTVLRKGQAKLEMLV